MNWDEIFIKVGFKEERFDNYTPGGNIRSQELSNIGQSVR